MVAYTDRALDPMPVDSLAGRRCLVTGGLGFIGSNLALALARGGAEMIMETTVIVQHGYTMSNVQNYGTARDVFTRTNP